MRKLLVLSLYPASQPPQSGGELRLLHLYAALTRWFQIDLISWTGATEPRETVSLMPGFVNHRIPVPTEHGRAIAGLEQQGIGGALFNTAAAMLGRGDTEYHALATALIRDADCVIHESPYTLFYDRGFGRDGKPRLYNAHNFEADMAAAYSPAPEIRDFAFHLERRLATEAAAVFATSELDAGKFACLYGVAPEAITLCPNGFHAADIPLPTRRPPGEPITAMFMGSAHPPNVDAARFVVHRLRPLFSEIRFVIAGSVCGMLRDAQADNLTLVPAFHNERKRSLLAETDIFLNPLAAGSGTSIKTIEAMAARLAILSTPIGSRGLGAVDRRHLLVADPDGFPNALSLLSGDPALRQSLGDAAAAWSRQNFEWQIIAERVAGTIERVCRDRPMPASPRRVKLSLAAAMPPPGAETTISTSDAQRLTLCFGAGPMLEIARNGRDEWSIQVPMESRHRRLHGLMPQSAETVLKAIWSCWNGELVTLFLRLAARASSVTFQDVALLPLLQLTGPLPDARFAPSVERDDFLGGVADHPDADLLLPVAEALWAEGIGRTGIAANALWHDRRLLVVTDQFEDPPRRRASHYLYGMLDSLALITGARLDVATSHGDMPDLAGPETDLAPGLFRIDRFSSEPGAGSPGLRRHLGLVARDYDAVLLDGDRWDDADAIRDIIGQHETPLTVLPRAADDPDGPILFGLDPAEFLFRTDHDHRFTRLHGSGRPFLLVLGRKNATAHLRRIADAYLAAAGPANGDLVFIGKGDETLVPRGLPTMYSYGWLERATVLGALRRCRGLITLRDGGGALTALEAWMSERPVIVSEANHPLAALVEDGRDGFVAGSTEALASAMATLLSQPGQADAMGRAGRRKADRFAWSEIARAVIARIPDRMSRAAGRYTR